MLVLWNHQYGAQLEHLLRGQTYLMRSGRQTSIPCNMFLGVSCLVGEQLKALVTTEGSTVGEEGIA